MMLLLWLKCEADDSAKTSEDHPKQSTTEIDGSRLTAILELGPRKPATRHDAHRLRVHEREDSDILQLSIAPRPHPSPPKNYYHLFLREAGQNVHMAVDFNASK
eukprot:6398682-Amphidinium_carterae.1